MMNHIMFYYIIIIAVTKPAYDQWPCQEPKLEAPTIYKAYVMAM